MSGFNDLIEIIREEGMKNYTPSFYFAKITKDYPDTALKFKDVEITSEYILYTAWARYLSEGFKTKPGGEHSDPKIGTHGKHDHEIELLKIKKGDTVMIRMMKNGKFLIIDKVVE